MLINELETCSILVPAYCKLDYNLDKSIAPVFILKASFKATFNLLASTVALAIYWLKPFVLACVPNVDKLFKEFCKS